MWLTLIQIEENYEKHKNKPFNKIQSEEYGIGMELDNLAAFKEFVLQHQNDMQNQQIKGSNFILVFSQIFTKKELCIAFLEKHKLSEYVFLEQTSLLCQIRGYVNEKKMKKSKEKGEKNYLCTISVKCTSTEITCNLSKLNALDCSEIKILWSMEKYKKNFFPAMRGNIFELVIKPNFKKMIDLIIRLKEPKFSELPQTDIDMLLNICKCGEFNDDQFNALKKVYHIILLILLMQF